MKIAKSSYSVQEIFNRKIYVLDDGTEIVVHLD